MVLHMVRPTLSLAKLLNGGSSWKVQYHSGSPILHLLNRHRRQDRWTGFANSIGFSGGACTLLF
jgi:hypothetical protein